jgi:hypothetical protein
MAEGKKTTSKPGAPQRAEDQAREGEAASNTFRAHLIRIPDKEARLQAIVVLDEVRVPYCGVTDHQFAVTNEHLAVLRREGIPFDVVS